MVNIFIFAPLAYYTTKIKNKSFKLHMANSSRKEPGTQPATNEIESNPVDSVVGLYEQYKKQITTVTTVLVVAVVSIVGYQKWYKAPNEEKAASALAMPELYYQVDSLNLALNGDGKNLGFAKITKKYDGTAAGNLARFYEGSAYLKMGDFKKAISALKDFDGKGTLLAYEAWGALGTAYMESGDKNNAIEYFKKATSGDDGLITPMYLYQLGLAYEASGKANEAKEAFKRIRDEYPRSINARDMDKELARMGQLD